MVPLGRKGRSRVSMPGLVGLKDFRGSVGTGVLPGWDLGWLGLIKEVVGRTSSGPESALASSHSTLSLGTG